MKPSLLVVSSFFCLSICGCSRKTTLVEQPNQLTANRSTITIPNKDVITIEEIALSDFSLIKTDSGLVYNIFGDINALNSDLGEYTPEYVYKNEENPDESIMNYSWSSLYLEWLKFNGTILKIIVNSNGYKTRRGIAVGDSVLKLDSLYGKDKGYRNANKIEFDLGNAESETMMALIFYLQNDLIIKIEITQGT